MAEVVLNPPAELPEHAGDVPLTNEQFLKLSFFKLSKKIQALEKFPGALRLRRFRAGESICRQGETGWTAFYTLTSEDVRQILLDLLHEPGGKRSRLEKELAEVEERLEQLDGQPSTHPLRAVATVQLRLARPAAAQPQSVMARLIGTFLGKKTAEPASRTRYISVEGSTGVIPYDTRQAPMYEGDVFGEMSCMYGFPRSATVAAQRDWYVLELLRNIFDQASRDASFEARMDQLYKERVLQNHLRALPIFADISEEEFTRIRDRVDLLRLADGDIICDQHQRPESMYIIRSGMVKVVRHGSALLSQDDVTSWPGLAKCLAEAAQSPGPRQAVWQALPETLRRSLVCNVGQALQTAGRLEHLSADLDFTDRQELLWSLNDQIVGGTLHALAECKTLLPAALAKCGLKPDAKRWSAKETRIVNRRLLGDIFPDALRDYQPGLEHIVAYCNRGEILGEIGLLAGTPVSATCTAYVHPCRDDPARSGVWRREATHIELVRISKELFNELVERVPSIKANVERIAAERQRQDVKRASTPRWSRTVDSHFTEEFEKLGLIQGQQLMLIDLDRCTRCDECVNACVDTHKDGRTRLFLDGPRFDKYLVPTTCRSCCDPVCMIGCPVGSIHRGNNGQIVIEDWCIGCELCAKNCPYGAIQMHDIGVIPAEALGWRFAPARAGQAQWMQPRFNDALWRAGRPPFYYDVTTKEHIGSETACYRLSFRPSTDTLRSAKEFTLEVASEDKEAQVWLNGQPLQASGPAKRGQREFPVPRSLVSNGVNVVAVQVTPSQKNMELLLDLRLDEVHRPESPLGAIGEFTEKPVTARAVVCDLCSSQLGQRPACVTACPHDAARRVNARFDFPA